MKYYLFFLLTFIPAFATAKPATELTGRYELQGERETSSTLVLRDNGQFEATYIYGNLDGHIQGRWQRKNDIVTLDAEGNSDAAQLFKSVPLAVGERCLVRDMGDHKVCYLRQPQLPYDAWHLGFFTPEHMDIWLETADVTDVRGITATKAMSGGVSSTGEVAGWPEKVGMGSGKYLSQLELPQSIYIRWQSLAEPQTYRATLAIPDSARNLMLEQEPVECTLTGMGLAYRNSIVIGLAPGGIAKLWVSGPCFKGTEVLRVQAEIEPKGPDQGQSDGEYALPLEPAAKTYIEKHGIPFNSW